MIEILEPRPSIPIDPNSFCDGHYYVLTTARLGGCGITPEVLSDNTDFHGLGRS
jgi:hypothetical protein